MFKIFFRGTPFGRGFSSFLYLKMKENACGESKLRGWHSFSWDNSFWKMLKNGYFWAFFQMHAILLKNNVRKNLKKGNKTREQELSKTCFRIKIRSFCQKLREFKDEPELVNTLKEVSTLNDGGIWAAYSVPFSFLSPCFQVTSIPSSSYSHQTSRRPARSIRKTPPARDLL